MPRKRLEGRSLKRRGAGVHSQRRRAGAEKTARPVPDRTRDTGSGRQACVNSRRTGKYRHTCQQIRGLRLWISRRQTAEKHGRTDTSKSVLFLNNQKICISGSGIYPRPGTGQYRRPVDVIRTVSRRMHAAYFSLFPGYLIRTPARQKLPAYPVLQLQLCSRQRCRPSAEPVPAAH